MLSKKQNTAQFGFYSTFEEQLSHQHPQYILANTINWNIFEEGFSKLYSDEGRPAKPIRLMVSLIILKHIRNISDESVVEQLYVCSTINRILFFYFGSPIKNRSLLHQVSHVFFAFCLFYNDNNKGNTNQKHNSNPKKYIHI